MSERAKWGRWEPLHPLRLGDLERDYGELVCGAQGCEERAQWMSAAPFLCGCATFLCDGCYRVSGVEWLVVRTVWPRGTIGVQRALDGPPMQLGPAMWDQQQ